MESKVRRLCVTQGSTLEVNYKRLNLVLNNYDAIKWQLIVCEVAFPWVNGVSRTSGVHILSDSANYQTWHL